jgi:K+-sensing histidine kinase KdpD
MSRDLLLLTPFEQTYSVGEITFSLRTTAFSQLGQLALRYIKMIIDAPALVFFRDDEGGLKVWAKSSTDLEITEQAYAAAGWTYDNGEVAGSGTNTFSYNPFYFYPMKSIEGIIYNSKGLYPEQRYLLGTVSNLVTIVATTWMNLNLHDT